MEDEFWTLFDRLIDESNIVIDRPRGSRHPRFDYTYTIDYGYLENTASPDGEGIDLWLGSGERRLRAVICTVDTARRDSEIKLLIGTTEEETAEIYEFHNKSETMKGLLIMRPERN